MPLPKIASPIFNLTLPLSKKSIRYRSFLVKEEKILLMAMESKDEKTIYNSVKQIANNCCLDKLDVDKLPLVDLEFLFLNLRAKSVGEIIDLQYKCNNKIEESDGIEKRCNNIIPIQINLFDIKIEIPKEHNNKIDLGNNIGIVMNYPSFNLIEKISDISNIDSIMSIIANCIDYVYDANEIYYRKDISKEELNEFIESLSIEQFTKIQEFFNSIPKLKKDVEFKCNKCGYSEIITIEGLQNFFG